jgi:hypothetical protein
VWLFNLIETTIANFEKFVKGYFEKKKKKIAQNI